MFARIRGRRRVLTPERKAELCRLVAESVSIESAADTLDVSLRTVQRERKNDEDFDHELRLSLQAEPDPKKLMQAAARTHWRAAAWLLERTDPETYARRPVNTAKPGQVDAALSFLLEAALQATPEDQRLAFFEKVNAARDQAFDCVFPNLGPWGHPRAPKCPPSPLTDELTWKRTKAERVARAILDRDEEGNIIPYTPPPAPTAEQIAAAEAFAAQKARLRAKLHAQRAALYEDQPADFLSPEAILSPETIAATKCDPTPTPPSTAPAPTLPTDWSLQRPVSPSTAPEPHAESAPPAPPHFGDNPAADMAAWCAAHRRTPFHQALKRCRENLSRKQRAATKSRKVARMRARRQAQGT